MRPRSGCRWRCSRRCSSSRAAATARRSATSPRWTSRRRVRTSTARKSWRSRRCACAIARSWTSITRSFARTGAIEPAPRALHGISDAEVATAPTFDEVWPRVRALCGADVVVAHNGHHFDFPILRRLSGEELCTYDTLPLARSLHAGSAKLSDLARHFGIDTGTSHRALDDTRALVGVCLALHALKESVARKTALVHLLDYLGVALTLWPDELDDEGDAAARSLSPVRARALQQLPRLLRVRARGAGRRHASDGARPHRLARRRAAHGAHPHREDGRRAVSGGDGPAAQTAGAARRCAARRSALPTAGAHSAFARRRRGARAGQGEPAHAPLDQRARVLAGVRRRRRERAASSAARRRDRQRRRRSRRRAGCSTSA